MVATEVLNSTTGNLSLKEGNAGVFRDIKVLEPGKKHIIEIDPNATYREYVVVSAPGGDKVFVTSDDCIDNSKITIIVKDGKYDFEAQPRGDAAAATAGAQSPTGGSAVSKFFRKIWPGNKKT